MTHLLQLQAAVLGWQQPCCGPLDLALARGEVLGLVGPNGAGKSTLLAALAGRARLFSGQLQRAPALRMVLQPQTPPAVDGLPLSGRDLLALTGASPAGLPDWLSGRLDERLDQLSGGQRHFLALWAILQSPGDLVLLDEPTNHLDAAGVAYLVGHVRERVARGAGMLIVSHDTDFVAAVCYRVIRLEAGDGV